MYQALFDEFLTGKNTLRIYDSNTLIFTSDKCRLLPLVEYIDTLASHHQNVVIFDKIVGRAAALLLIKADCREVYSPLSSRLAIEVLEQHGIKHHLNQIVPCIQTPDNNMCPMEELSIGKEPEEFYNLIRSSPVKNHP